MELIRSKNSFDWHKKFEQIKRREEDIYSKGYTIEILIHLKDGTKFRSEMQYCFEDHEKELFYFCDLESKKSKSAPFKEIRDIADIGVTCFINPQYRNLCLKFPEE